MGLAHYGVLRFTLDEEDRNRSIGAALLSGPILLGLGSLPFVTPFLVGLLLMIIGHIAMIRLMHDQPIQSCIMILIADIIMAGGLAFLIVDVYMLVTGMNLVKAGL
jgi:hypothetical protein